MVYDYTDESKDQKQKSERLAAIGDLTSMLIDQRSVTNLFIPNIESVMDMIKKNIFRPLPNTGANNLKLSVSETGVEEEEQEPDPSWAHIRGVYEIFLQLIINEACDVKTFKPFVTPNFIADFLQLFDSDLVEERDFLKNILHKLYAKLVPRRKMIRKAITDLFHILIHEIHKFNGTSELLDIMASIISGFALPLREEHVIFFKNIIIPLHKVQTSTLYFDNLCRCSMLFLSKDNTLAIPLLEGILKYWPFANYVKETSFLQELPEVLEMCDVEKIQPLVGKLFKRVIKCISGSHLQIADRAMCLFESESFISIIKHYKTQTFNILVPVVTNLAENHWHQMLKESLNALKEILQKIDPQAYASALEGLDSKKYDKSIRTVQPPEERLKLDQKWKNLTKQAAKNHSDFVEPILPFSDGYLLADYNNVYKSIYNKEKYLND